MSAQAGGVVGNGQPGSCTSAALAQAVIGGGLVSFKCPPNSVTVITSSVGLIPPPHTTIDVSNNGSLVTLSGANTNRILLLFGSTAWP